MTTLLTDPATNQQPAPEGVCAGVFLRRVIVLLLVAPVYTQLRFVSTPRPFLRSHSCPCSTMSRPCTFSIGMICSKEQDQCPGTILKQLTMSETRCDNNSWPCSTMSRLCAISMGTICAGLDSDGWRENVFEGER